MSSKFGVSLMIGNLVYLSWFLISFMKFLKHLLILLYDKVLRALRISSLLNFVLKSRILLIVCFFEICLMKLKVSIMDANQGENAGKYINLFIYSSTLSKLLCFDDCFSCQSHHNSATIKILILCYLITYFIRRMIEQFCIYCWIIWSFSIWSWSFAFVTVCSIFSLKLQCGLRNRRLSSTWPDSGPKVNHSAFIKFMLFSSKHVLFLDR